MKGNSVMNSKYRNKVIDRNRSDENPNPPKVITMVLPDGYSVYIAAPEDGYYILTDWPLQGEKGNNITIQVSRLMNTRIEFIEL